MIRLAQEGDARAFAGLVDRHRPQVEAVAWRLTGEGEAVRDITHETFVRMHAALPRFRHDASLATWLYRIVVNLCRDRARGVSRDRSVPLATVRETPSPAATPDVLTEAAERARVMDHVVQSLPDAMREAVVLRYAAALSYEEIAATLGIAPGTVASRIHRALRILGLMLEAHGIREDSL